MSIGKNSRIVLYVIPKNSPPIARNREGVEPFPLFLEGHLLDGRGFRRLHDERNLGDLGAVDLHDDGIPTLPGNFQVGKIEDHADQVLAIRRVPGERLPLQPQRNEVNRETAAG